MRLARIGGVTLVGLLGVNIYGEAVHIVDTGPQCFLSRDGRIVVCDRLSNPTRLPDHTTESNTVTLVSGPASSS